MPVNDVRVCKQCGLMYQYAIPEESGSKAYRFDYCSETCLINSGHQKCCAFGCMKCRYDGYVRVK